MFVATTLLYPLALALLCLGAGLLADRLGGGWLAPTLLAPVGAALLIAVSQLTTLPSWLAPATPWLLAAVALAGFLSARTRARELLLAVRLAGAPAAAAPLAASLLAYLLALAPVLLSGRPSFSSGALSDPAVHLIGADYLIHHGQSYGHLDLSNSYGRFVKNYYGTYYPSGADTWFGGSALLLGLPLIWAYQPFNAFLLALACGPAWTIARRLGLGRGPAMAAALAAVLPALVYGYELEGSIKELTAVAVKLACGCLVTRPGEWVRRGPRAVVPLALLFAAGLSALGPAFGAWAAACTIALVAAVWLGGERLPAPRLIATSIAAGAGVLGIAALATWTQIRGAVQVAGNIASTSNSGNLKAPLHSAQVLGVWLNGSFKIAPTGAAHALTVALEALVVVAALAGAAACLRRSARGIGVWVAMMLVTWLAISHAVTTWADAKTLVLTSPAVMLLAWGGIAALAGLARRAIAARAAVAVAAAAILAGVLVSDELQYNAVDLAPTARYDELARIDRAFAGRGPVLFTDFDEYAMYSLRDLDVGSPNFVYPSPALQAAAAGYGRPFSLEAIPPAALTAYRLIVTRRDPQSPRPPAAYALAWAGSYYLVWRRVPGAGVPVGTASLAAVGHGAGAGTGSGFGAGSPPGASSASGAGAESSSSAGASSGAGARSDGSAGSGSSACATIRRLARAAGPTGSLAAAAAPQVVAVSLASARRPPAWGRAPGHITMKQAGVLSARLSLPMGGWWDVWLRGRLMPSIAVSIDGRRIGEVAGQVSGNSLITAPAPPLRAHLTAGPHTLQIQRFAPTLAPGDRGAAVLSGLFLTPNGEPPAGRLLRVPTTAWPELCAARRLQWVEATR